MRPMTLPSASLTEASNLPPPTSLTPWCTSAPASRSASRTLLDVVNVPVGDGTRHPLAVAVGIQTDVLASDVEADVVGLVHAGLHTHKLAVQCLGVGEVPNGVHDRLDAFSH